MLAGSTLKPCRRAWRGGPASAPIRWHGAPPDGAPDATGVAATGKRNADRGEMILFIQLIQQSLSGSENLKKKGAAAAALLILIL